MTSGIFLDSLVDKLMESIGSSVVYFSVVVVCLTLILAKRVGGLFKKGKDGKKPTTALSTLMHRDYTPFSRKPR